MTHDQPRPSDPGLAEGIHLGVLPAPFDYLEDNWRCVHITFRPGATSEVAEELLQLATEFDQQGNADGPFEDVSLASCAVWFEFDANAETVTLSLYRAAYYVAKHGVPHQDHLITLTDPDDVWSAEAHRQTYGGLARASRAPQVSVRTPG